MAYDKSWIAIRQPWKVDHYFNVNSPRRMDLSITDFDLANAWWCAEFSRLAYQIEETRVHSELSQNGFQDIVVMSAGRSFALAFKGQDTNGDPFTVISFRGTDSLTDWIGNFKVTPEQWGEGGAVHKGFVEAYELLQPQLEQVMQKADRVVLTGHSLGGALALLAASDYGLNTCFVYTFGAPKVGDDLFNQSIKNVPVFRMTNSTDIVPMAPPSTKQIDFQHCGNLYRVNDDGAGVECLKNSQETLKDINLKYDSESTLLSPPKFASDHAPTNYVAPLNQLLSRV